MNKHYAKIPHYTIYDTKYPSRKSHDVSAIIIKTNNKATFNYLQVTTEIRNLKWTNTNVSNLLFI